MTGEGPPASPPAIPDIRPAAPGPSRPSAARVRAALADAVPRPFWLDQPTAPEPSAPLAAPEEADLAVIGGGFSGLWTALLAKEGDPARDVMLLEANTVGAGPSGRNGGFCEASLTHGLANGAAHFPDEIAELERLGRQNLDEIEASIARHGIDCGFERTGGLCVATRPWQLEGFAETRDLAARIGGDSPELLDAAAVRAQLDSPIYVGGLWDRRGTAILDPARLAWGLREACLRLGVRIFERTPVRRLEPIGVSGGVSGAGHAAARLRLHTPYGRLDARQVALATGPDATLLRRLRHFVVPVYDYALMTEPLTPSQLASIGWKSRAGVSDAANQFHYYRLTADNRILWGGYDAIYYPGGRISPARDQRPETHQRLARHFFETFPQLRDLRFTHKWGGVIDTCSRFCVFFGRAYGGRLAYATGYTGLGVGASRFGARVMLDLLRGEETDLTRLKLVRTRPVPFPPEPIRTGVIALTRWSIAQADRHDGRRNLWLRTLDRLGVGFDS